MYSKEVNLLEIDWLKQYAAETLCILECWFPPSFWDIMLHLVIHVVDELAIYGPVGCRWMYLVERYLGVLKKHVRKRSLPEGSMAEGYIVDEALGFVLNTYKDILTHGDASGMMRKRQA